MFRKKIERTLKRLGQVLSENQWTCKGLQPPQIRPLSIKSISFMLLWTRWSLDLEKNALYFIMESIQIWNLTILKSRSVYVPIWAWGAHPIFNLRCLCAPQDLLSPFPQTIPPTVSFSSCSADFITGQPRATQQTRTSNIQHQLHPSTCLFSLLIEMSGFSGDRSNVSSSPFTSSLEYASHLLSYFNFTPLHCNRVFSPNCVLSTKACDESRKGVTLVYSQHRSQACASDDLQEERLKSTRHVHWKYWLYFLDVRLEWVLFMNKIVYGDLTVFY